MSRFSDFSTQYNVFFFFFLLRMNIPSGYYFSLQIAKQRERSINFNFSLKNPYIMQNRGLAFELKI